VIGLVSANTECAPETVRLSSLIKNMTQHIHEVMSSEQVRINGFREHAVSSRDEINKKLEETQKLLSFHKYKLGQATIALNEGSTQQSRLEGEGTLVRSSAQTIEADCQRNEQLFLARQKEFHDTLHFVELIQQVLMNPPKDQDPTQNLMVLQGLVDALPALTSTSASAEHSKKRAGQMAEVQTLIQQKMSSQEVDWPVESALTSLFEMLKAQTEEAVQSDRESHAQLSRECSRQLEIMRNQISSIESQLQVATERIKEANAKVAFETSEVQVLSSDVEVLSFAKENKHTVVDLVDGSYFERNEALSSQFNQLQALISEPRCCLCNN
jgi:hypothetical protein